MSEYFTTRELAAFLRVKERKVYDLVAQKALPMRRVTGKLLFPKNEIESWIAESANKEASRSKAAVAANYPPVIAGGHDPLLEWALRESRCGIAALFDGALDGVVRFKAHGCLAAGLHIPSVQLTDWNVAAVEKDFGDKPVVLIEFGKRTRGLMYRASPKRQIASIAEIGEFRFQSRQPEAGSELILAALLAEKNMTKADLRTVDAIERSETDLAMAIAAGRADIGLGVEAAAKQFQLAFTPLVVERFDLLVWRKAYFDPPFQQLLHFCASDAFKARSAALGGYDCAALGAVRFNGP